MSEKGLVEQCVWLCADAAVGKYKFCRQRCPDYLRNQCNRWARHFVVTNYKDHQRVEKEGLCFCEQVTWAHTAANKPKTTRKQCIDSALIQWAKDTGGVDTTSLCISVINGDGEIIKQGESVYLKGIDRLNMGPATVDVVGTQWYSPWSGKPSCLIGKAESDIQPCNRGFVEISETRWGKQAEKTHAYGQLAWEYGQGPLPDMRTTLLLRCVNPSPADIHKGDDVVFSSRLVRDNGDVCVVPKQAHDNIILGVATEDINSQRIGWVMIG
jgi:hypothetical protein